MRKCGYSRAFLGEGASSTFTIVQTLNKNVVFLLIIRYK